MSSQPIGKKKIRTYMFFHSLDIYTPREEKEGMEHYYTLIQVVRRSLTSLGPKVVRLYLDCTENLPDGSPILPGTSNRG